MYNTSKEWLDYLFLPGDIDLGKKWKIKNGKAGKLMTFGGVTFPGVGGLNPIVMAQQTGLEPFHLMGVLLHRGLQQVPE